MIKTACAHFPLDRPCAFHKKTKQLCDTCGHYRPVTAPAGAPPNILIIKLGAMGDVLRTTFLLPGIKEVWPGARITWLVAAGSEPILEGNPHLARIWPMDKTVYGRLAAERFDIVINLDLSPESLLLTRAVPAARRIGFTLDDTRQIRCSNSTARRWLAMSGNDVLKKQNTATYQHWMARIVGLPRDTYEIFTPLAPASLKKAAAFARTHGLVNKKVIGINPGAGARWKLKRWTTRGYQALIRRLTADGYAILLLGGRDENALVTSLARGQAGTVVNGGTDNSLPDFFALLNLCDLVITGDTLALHAALGLRKKVVALFGPTSAPEIALYGRGVKVVSSRDCICCYRQACDMKPTCMDVITTDMVEQAVRQCLS